MEKEDRSPPSKRNGNFYLLWRPLIGEQLTGLFRTQLTSGYFDSMRQHRVASFGEIFWSGENGFIRCYSEVLQTFSVWHDEIPESDGRAVVDGVIESLVHGVVFGDHNRAGRTITDDGG